MNDYREALIAALEALEADDVAGAKRTIVEALDPTYPRCCECGERFPSADLLERHRVRDCHGLIGGRRWAK
jgi:hypothetical protein